MSNGFRPDFEQEYTVCGRLQSLATTLSEKQINLNTRYERLLLGFFAKDLNLFGSVLVLCTHGYGESALILCRVLLEDVVNIDFIGLKPSARSKLFMEYEYVEKKRGLDTLQALGQPVDSLLDEAQESWLPRYHKVKKNYPDENRWAHRTVSGEMEGLTLWEMARMVGAEDPYRLIYPFASRLIHGTASGLELYTRVADSKRPIMKFEPDADKVDLVLPMAFYLFWAITKKFADKFQPDAAPRLVELKAEGQRIFERTD